MTGHYYAAAFSPAYVVFGSRWGEVLVVDRATRRSYYDHSDTSGPECDYLSAIGDDAECVLFDVMCGALINDAEQPDELPPSVLKWLEMMEARREQVA